MRNDGILPQFANIVCTQCYATYRKLSWKLVSINYPIYWGINSPKFINFVYRFCIPSLSNLSDDQDDVMMVEEESSEAETIAEAILQKVIKTETTKL